MVVQINVLKKAVGMAVTIQKKNAMMAIKMMVMDVQVNA